MAAFDGASITSEAGLLLLRQLDQGLSLLDLARATDPLVSLLQGLPVLPHALGQLTRPVVSTPQCKQNCTASRAPWSSAARSGPAASGSPASVRRGRSRVPSPFSCGIGPNVEITAYRHDNYTLIHVPSMEYALD